VTDAAHWIDGEPATFPDEAPRAVRSPFSGEVLARIPEGSPAAVDTAVNAATRAFRAWRRVPLGERLAAVRAWLERVERERDTLERTLVAEVGKPIRAARSEVDSLLSSCRYLLAQAPGAIADEEIPGYDRFTPRVTREPVGVVAAITPFNFPALLLAWKLCPAVLAGCTVVSKPDPRTPLATAALARWAAEAGWPPGVFNVVHGDRDAGAGLVSHPGVAKVAFTGSVEAGRAVYESAAEGIRRVTLELGGCSALVVCRDGDFQGAMPQILHRCFFNAGQYCFRVNRVLVERSRHDALVAALVAAASRLVVGDPREEGTDLGPLIDRPAFDEVVRRIEDAEARGARVVLDGRRAARAGASLIGPTLVCDVPEDATLARSETFGPVVSVAPFHDLDEAIALANDTEYGLAAFALTADRATGARLARDLEAGTVWVNALGESVPELPFGGVKQSGIGVEKSRWAFEEYLQRKAVYFGFPKG